MSRPDDSKADPARPDAAPDALARLLARLRDTGRLPLSQMSARSRRELASLFDAGALGVVRSGVGQVVEVRSPEVLDQVIRNRYPEVGIRPDTPPRAGAVARLRSAKRARGSDRKAVLLRALRPVVCARDGAQADLLATTRRLGCAALVVERGQFWTLTATVAVVENEECFHHVERLGVDADLVLFASGRLSALVLEWLGSPELGECRFIHCGDYDPVGLDEFLKLRAAVGSRARLHIPERLRELVATHGRKELLRDSARILARLRRTDDPQVRQVVSILDETGCGLEQEILLALP